jgi:hypothetical protein
VNAWRLEGYEEELRSVYVGYSAALDRFLKSSAALAEREKQGGDDGSESDEDEEDEGSQGEEVGS